VPPTQKTEKRNTFVDPVGDGANLIITEKTNAARRVAQRLV